MILNKSAVERGLGHATMLKTEQVDLSKESGTSSLSALLLALHADMCLRGCRRSYGCWGRSGGISCNVTFFKNHTVMTVKVCIFDCHANCNVKTYNKSIGPAYNCCNIS